MKKYLLLLVLIVALVGMSGVVSASAPVMSNLTNSTPMATTVHITWNTDILSNNTVKYSNSSDMSNSLWSNWANNTTSIDIKLWNLQPETTYYYQAYSYNATNESEYSTSSVQNFTTPACVNYKLVNPGESIQDAIDNLCPQGGIVELAAGTYYLPQGGTIDLTVHTNQKTSYSPIQIGPDHWIGTLTYKYAIILNERNNITIKGAGRDDTILINKDEGYPKYHMIFIVKGSNITIKDLSIRSNTTSDDIPVDTGDGILIHGKTLDSSISNVRVERLSHGIGAYVCLHALKEYHGTENITIKDCQILYHRYPITWVSVYNSTITNCEIGYGTSAYGIDLNGLCQYNIIEKNVVHHSANGGISTYTNNYKNIIRDNICYNNQYGIQAIQYTRDIEIINNTCRDNRIDGISVVTNDLESDLIHILNNRVYNNTRHGISIFYYPNPARDDHDPPYDINIELNTIYSNGGDGIMQNINLYDIIVRNNIITNNSGYGINHLNNESQFIISYNDVWGNVLGSYNGVSAGTGDISSDPLFANPPNDFHLKSQYGRWNGSTWVFDDVTSPCIDAGDPSSDYSNEPAPNGGRINMGAYGNTGEASKSSSATGIISGTVTNTTGIAIQGATVQANSYSNTTNTTGGYTITLPVGNYTVTASKVGYQSQSKPAEVIANQTTEVNFILTVATTTTSTTSTSTTSTSTSISVTTTTIPTNRWVVGSGGDSWSGNVSHQNTTQVQATGKVELKQSVDDYVSYWRFDEGTGTKAYDENITNNNTGNLSGPTWNSSGKFGSALSFDGTDDYVNFGNGASLNITDRITVAFWIKDAGLTDRVVISKGDFADDGWYIFSKYWNTDHVAVTISKPGGYQEIQSSINLSDEWTYIVVILDNIALKVHWYKNGDFIQTSNANWVWTGNVDRLFTIGCYSDGGWNFKGTIDEVRIYNRNLSATEINQTMNNSHHTSGNLISIVKDAESISGSGSVWKQIKYQGTFPAGTNVSIYVNMSADNSTWGGWQLVKENATNGTFYELPTSNQTRYGSWRIVLQTNNASITPEIYNVTFITSGTTTTTTTTSTTISTTTTLGTTTTTSTSTSTTTLPATTTSTTVPVTTTTSTSTTTTTSSTTTLPCTLPGDYPTCGEVTLAEVVDFIVLWSQGQADLEDVINLINAWATG